ncbi:AraC family transcriptional regulator [Agathobaculum sp. NTUH-O15-33]|uniref:AraC family transcriptional regulator n=1 Tax=Agathobaculum sp. NTUH-O15-33 TaxID=3079302 RepID=UPI002958AAC0|nr:AraC family transcriptional regulator [Agathobaculum sp. NTUH-O15-33]WNX86276.1 AraC family transcriptional regulator [Agathobaculum sp. NTUH-O15-33]
MLEPEQNTAVFSGEPTFFINNKPPHMQNIIHISNCPIYSYPCHSHASWAEIVLIIGGSGVYTVNRDEYIVEAGDILLINRGVLHSCDSSFEDPVDVYTLSLNEFTIRGLEMGQLIAPDVQPFLKTGAQLPLFAALFSCLMAQNLEKPPGHLMICTQTISLLCALLHQMIRRKTFKIQPRSISKLASDIMEYIEENYTSNITLDLLSKRFFITAGHLCHILSTECGISPIDYVIQKRINTAQWRLVMESTSIKDIAFDMGYESADHFAKQFQKRTGMTPSVYRTLYSHRLKYLITDETP